MTCLTLWVTAMLLLAEPPGVPAQGPASWTPQIDRALEKFMALDLAPGMAVAVVRGRDVVYLKGFGYADVELGRGVTPQTVFYIASATKPFTGTAVSILETSSTSTGRWPSI